MQRGHSHVTEEADWDNASMHQETPRITPRTPGSVALPPLGLQTPGLQNQEDKSYCFRPRSEVPHGNSPLILLPNA